MSQKGQRARRRAERERREADLAERRRRDRAAAERRARRRAPFRRLVRDRPRRSGGVLARRRRQQARIVLAVTVLVNVVVWALGAEWPGRLAAAVLSLLFAPIVYALVSRR